MKTKAVSRILAALLAATICISALPAAAETDAALSAARDLASIYGAVPAGAGSEWAVIAMVRGGLTAPEGWLEGYYAALEAQVSEKEGIVNPRRITDQDRVILAATALGKDARRVAGYDLTAPLGDFDRAVSTGLNGAVWALKALDCGNYPVPATPAGKTQTTRDGLIAHILTKEKPGGGFAQTGEYADSDMTAMALQALAPYRERADVGAAVERGVAVLSAMQRPDGGYATWGNDTCESTAQVMVTLATLDIPLSDERFVKNGCTVLDGLLRYYRPGEGFLHMDGPGMTVDGMATGQAFYALAALLRQERGQTPLYQMTDVFDAASAPLFSDLEGQPCRAAVEALAKAGIVNGMGDGTFAPEKTMTRAEFCAIIVRGVGRSPASGTPFSDVPGSKWYTPWIAAAFDAGIVQGVGGSRFIPESTISRQEAAVMVRRAARILGFEGTPPRTDILSARPDGDSVAKWAREDVAFCLENGLWPVLTDALEPACPILRGELAEMLYRLLVQAGRLEA